MVLLFCYLLLKLHPNLRGQLVPKERSDQNQIWCISIGGYIAIKGQSWVLIINTMPPRDTVYRIWSFYLKCAYNFAT